LPSISFIPLTTAINPALTVSINLDKISKSINNLFLYFGVFLSWLQFVATLAFESCFEVSQRKFFVVRNVELSFRYCIDSVPIWISTSSKWLVLLLCVVLILIMII
jgi:TRAP-type mannitol/chloroaromatic compound transport system permease small subunit